ncbi:MAG: hypothetical protein SFV18_21370 [Bryobacteraceae bacterium]|nr:hypothetical protein [Bryobacteraceae bacterium]
MIPAILLLAITPAPQDDPSAVAAQLPKIRRIYVDKLTGGEAAAQIRDMLMSSLQAAKLWVITENPEKADAFLRGAAEDLIYTEVRDSNDSVNARATVSTRDGTYSTGSRGNREDRSASVGIGQSEGQRIQERKHEATAALRLVNKDGDLIWSTTKESSGAKFRGSAADVADKVVKQLVADVQTARGGNAK